MSICPQHLEGPQSPYFNFLIEKPDKYSSPLPLFLPFSKAETRCVHGMGAINCAKLCLSHPFSRIKWIRQWAVDRDPVLTSTTSAKIGKTAIGGPGSDPRLRIRLAPVFHNCLRTWDFLYVLRTKKIWTEPREEVRRLSLVYESSCNRLRLYFVTAARAQRARACRVGRTLEGRGRCRAAPSGLYRASPVGRRSWRHTRGARPCVFRRPQPVVYSPPAAATAFGAPPCVAACRGPCRGRRGGGFHAAAEFASPAPAVTRPGAGRRGTRLWQPVPCLHPPAPVGGSGTAARARAAAVYNPRR